MEMRQFKRCHHAPKIHFDHLEGVGEVDPTMARKIKTCNFNSRPDVARYALASVAKTCRPILTLNRSNGAAWSKEVPFEG